MLSSSLQGTVSWAVSLLAARENTPVVEGQAYRRERAVGVKCNRNKSNLRNYAKPLVDGAYNKC